MFVVSTPVSKEPLVPVPPPPEDLQYVLLVDVQKTEALPPEAMVVELMGVTPVAIELEETESDIPGRESTRVTEPPPPPHDARLNKAIMDVKNILT